MYSLSNLLSILALVASIDARVVNHLWSRRGDNATAMSASVPSTDPPSATAYYYPNINEFTIADAVKAAAVGSNSAGGTSKKIGAPRHLAAGTAAGVAAGARAIYFMTNQDENGVIMLPVQPDGTLAAGSIISTGGAGASLIDAATGQPVQTDTLASQGAVRVAGSSLFAVNAGSNSLSMFAIDPHDPARLAAVGQPVETGGDVRWMFPSTWRDPLSPRS